MPPYIKLGLLGGLAWLGLTSLGAIADRMKRSKSDGTPILPALSTGQKVVIGLGAVCAALAIGALFVPSSTSSYVPATPGRSDPSGLFPVGAQPARVETLDCN